MDLTHRESGAGAEVSKSFQILQIWFWPATETQCRAPPLVEKWAFTPVEDLAHSLAPNCSREGGGWVEGSVCNLGFGSGSLPEWFGFLTLSLLHAFHPWAQPTVYWHSGTAARRRQRRTRVLLAESRSPRACKTGGCGGTTGISVST